jgi:hypothetical protein
MPPNQPDTSQSLGNQLEDIINKLPEDNLRLSEIMDRFGAQGLLLMSALLTLVFLIPVSIPGVSTVFGAAILLVGISRLFNRPLWLPAKVRERPLPTERLRPALLGGLTWVRRLEKISRAHRLAALADGRFVDVINNLTFILAAVLLMAPFGFIPFSNTLPALALLFYAIGLLQRDGVAILLGHLANIATLFYFALLIGGGGLAIKEIFQRMSS